MDDDTTTEEDTTAMRHDGHAEDGRPEASRIKWHRGCDGTHTQRTGLGSRLSQKAKNMIPDDSSSRNTEAEQDKVDEDAVIEQFK